jgi:glycosyltransferase involved in cell wall biosynthesis
VSRVLFISYNSLIEPLGPTQILPYVRALAGTFDVSVLSFEKPVRSVEEDARDRAATMARLGAAGIEWFTLTYHKRPSLPATLFDIACGQVRIAREHRRRPFDLLHARGYVPAAIAGGIKKWAGVPFLFDIRGLQAEEYVDAGLWTAGSLPFKLTKRVEQWLLSEADGIVTLTEAVRPILRAFPGLRQRRTLPPWTVIPTCVDVEHFAFDPAGRERVRASLSLGDRPVLVYSGSVGTWYLMDEMLDFYQAARERWPGLFFLALVNRSPEMVAQALAARGVPMDDFAVTWVRHEEIPAYLSAADAAIAFIRPSLSKQSSSPTKYAEYLSCGLPFVANSGVGDVDSLLNGGDAGVLVSEYSRQGYGQAADRLRMLAAAGSRHRRREMAERQFSVAGRAFPAYRDLYSEILQERVA